MVDTPAAVAMEQTRTRLVADSAYAPRLLGITNRPESSLGRMVEQVLGIGAGIEVGVAATKTFLGQLLAFYGLALAFAERRVGNQAALGLGGGTISRERLQALVAGLRAVPEQLRQLIEDHDRRVAALAHHFESTQVVIFLGRGINFPIALEGALKLKEISYIHAEGYPAGEMKHGPIALLDARVPVVSIAVPGKAIREIIYNDRVVGDTTPEATERAARLYRCFSRCTVAETTASTAELAKLAENTFRDINIVVAAAAMKDPGNSLYSKLYLACSQSIQIGNENMKRRQSTSLTYNWASAKRARTSPAHPLSYCSKIHSIAQICGKTTHRSSNWILASIRSLAVKQEGVAKYA